MTGNNGNTENRAGEQAIEHDSSAEQELSDLIVTKMRELAHDQGMAPESLANGTLTAPLVHTAYLDMTSGRRLKWPKRRFFFLAAARAVRQLSQDEARQQGKMEMAEASRIKVLDRALNRLATRAAEALEVFLLRHFAGLSMDNIARAMEVSPDAVEAKWAFARAFVHRWVTTSANDHEGDSHDRAES